MSKNLVAYFSKTGEQYGVGNISKGNTAILAETIAKKIDADIFEIKVENDEYPSTYTALVKYAQKEKQENLRPDIVGEVSNFEDYENVFLGYPNWWGDMPMPVHTFLDEYDFSGKNIYHFCTHEGSGGVKKDGLAMYGHIVQSDEEETDKRVTGWLNSLNL